MTSPTLHYLIAVLDVDTRLTETVSVVSGQEVSWGLGMTHDVAEFGESVFDSLSGLLSGIDERMTDQPAEVPGQLRLLPCEPRRQLPFGAQLQGEKESYRVAELIGRGGTAEVYKVRSEAGQVFAAKVLSSHRFEITPAMQDRFAREIATLATFCHDNIVRLADVATFAEAPVLLMELISDSLKNRLAKDMKWGFSHLRAWTRGALRALTAIHAVEVVHRDVTPKNLLVRTDDTVVLADFGTSRNVLDVTVTRPGDEIGSLLYISQDQFDNPHAAGPPDDIYSLGRVLWEAAAGRRLLRVLHPLQVLRPDLPPLFVDLVDEMTSENPRDRPTSAEALARIEGTKQESRSDRRSDPPPGGLTDDPLSEEVTARLAHARHGDEALFDAVGRAPSSAVLRAALLRAEELRLISRRMPRVPLFDTPYVVRFVPALLATRRSQTATSVCVQVIVEDLGGAVKRSFDWTKQMTPADLSEAIGMWLVDSGRYPGDAAYQPGRMFHDLRALLRRAHARITGSAGVTLDLAPVIQLFGDADAGDFWWITDVGVQRDGLIHTYTIEKSRFEELDWDEHVRGRAGVDVSAFRMALETARELRGQRLL